MTVIPAPTLSQQSFKRGRARRNLGSKWSLALAAALFLALAIVEFSIIALAAPNVAEIGPFAVTVP